ncbi:helix-turn-helix transcriptional regulator [Arthrobacter sp. CAU 1506]|uniref:ArsR/SmtB family transcription factor n=1 Tax=Arthrobacter sp. CAU 1506 TaxID=2560052 RepID=UPI0010AD8A2B|nr:metalloregulator ArsR/SmtB family transcription factor [Arthrobacter sp. CAU 1506]TJY70078.1 helix-turn-helix transcriptional regulator [Arthrobacter sp. CAU 1506]
MDRFPAADAPLYEVKANLFKGLSHPVRIRVLELLADTAEVTVTELMQGTNQEASNLSQHLAVLRRYNLVVAQRRGVQVFYRLAYPQVADLLTVARSLLQQLLHTTTQQLAGFSPPAGESVPSTAGAAVKEAPLR